MNPKRINSLLSFLSQYPASLTSSYSLGVVGPKRFCKTVEKDHGRSMKIHIGGLQEAVVANLQDLWNFWIVPESYTYIFIYFLEPYQ